MLYSSFTYTLNQTLQRLQVGFNVASEWRGEAEPKSYFSLASFALLWHSLHDLHWYLLSKPSFFIARLALTGDVSNEGQTSQVSHT
jgi:hypothetical protein